MLTAYSVMQYLDLRYVIELANLFRAKVVNVAESRLMLELTGEPEKIDSFIGLLQPYGVKEIVRTGISALERD